MKFEHLVKCSFWLTLAVKGQNITGVLRDCIKTESFKAGYWNVYRFFLLYVSAQKKFRLPLPVPKKHVHEERTGKLNFP